MNPNPEKNCTVKLNKDNFFVRIFKALGLNRRKALIESDLSENEELVQSIKNAKLEWINANMNFENAGENELVDYYAYRIKACQVRYEYYIKKAKEKGLKLETLDVKQRTFQ